MAYKNKSLKRSLALLALLVLAGPICVVSAGWATEFDYLSAKEQQQRMDIYQKMQDEASFIAEGNSEKVMQFFQ